MFFFQIRAHHALHGVAVVANDLGQRGAGEHGLTVGLFLQNDLQQDTARQVFLCFRIDNNKILIAEHELLHIREGDVRTGLGVV